MQKKTLIVIIVLIILVVGFLGYSKLAGKTATNPTVTIKTAVQPKKENTATGTLKDLFSQGLTQKCTITYPNNRGTGIIYFSGKKFSGVFTMIDDKGQAVTGNSISDGTYVYAWSSASPTGIKLQLNSALENTPTGTTGTTQTAAGNFNEQAKLSCSGWTLDQAKFTPPANIQFHDFSNLLPKVTGVIPQTGEQKAGNSICDKITDPTAKAACQNAIKNAGQ